MNEMYVNPILDSKYMQVCSSPQHNRAPKLTFSPVNYLLLVLSEPLTHTHAQRLTVAGPTALVPRYGDGYIIINCRHNTVCVSVARISVVRHVEDMILFDVAACMIYLHSVCPGAGATVCTRYRRRNRTGTWATGFRALCAFKFPTRLYLVIIRRKFEYTFLLRNQFVGLNLEIDV